MGCNRTLLRCRIARDPDSIPGRERLIVEIAAEIRTPAAIGSARADFAIARSALRTLR
jgi:hypothetical protein